MTCLLLSSERGSGTGIQCIPEQQGSPPEGGGGERAAVGARAAGERAHEEGEL